MGCRPRPGSRIGVLGRSGGEQLHNQSQGVAAGSAFGDPVGDGIAAPAIGEDGGVGHRHLTQCLVVAGGGGGVDRRPGLGNSSREVLVGQPDVTRGARRLAASRAECGFGGGLQRSAVGRHPARFDGWQAGPVAVIVDDHGLGRGAEHPASDGSRDHVRLRDRSRSQFFSLDGRDRELTLVQHPQDGAVSSHRHARRHRQTVGQG
jgi:hypothetical protein